MNWIKLVKISTWFLLLILVHACTTKELSNFDSKSWKKDENGCLGSRKALVETVLARKQEILGYTEVEILRNFGKPDVNDLRRRQQKFYYYYVSGSDKCPNQENAKILKFRFNAIDKVQEILYE